MHAMMATFERFLFQINRNQNQAASELRDLQQRIRKLETLQFFALERRVTEIEESVLGLANYHNSRLEVFNEVRHRIRFQEIPCPRGGLAYRDEAVVITDPTCLTSEPIARPQPTDPLLNSSEIKSPQPTLMDSIELADNPTDRQTDRLTGRPADRPTTEPKSDDEWRKRFARLQILSDYDRRTFNYNYDSEDEHDVRPRRRSVSNSRAYRFGRASLSSSDEGYLSRC